MPLVAEHWGPHGLVDWKVVEFGASPVDGKKPYSVQAILTWKDRAAMDAALGDKDAAGKVFGDVGNFSNKAPMFIAGDVKGSG